MRFTGAEVHQVGTLGTELFRFSRNRHGCGNLDALNAIGEKRGKLSSSCSHDLTLHKRCVA